MVAEPAGNDGVVHDGLIRLILKVRIPAVLEVGSRPILKLLQLFRCWSDLDAGLNTVGSQWTGSLEVPFLEDAYADKLGDLSLKDLVPTFLCLWITACKIIKALGAGLGTEYGEGQVMVLEIETNSGKVDDRLNAGALQFLGITCGLQLDHAQNACRDYPPIPERCRIKGDERVPPETTICFRALKIRPFSSLGSSGLVGLHCTS